MAFKATARRRPRAATAEAGTRAPEGLREKNKREKEERLLNAAWTLFSERGFEATTTRDIAERAGVGAGTLFLYVRTKEELLVRLFRTEIERLQEKLFRALDSNAPLLEQLVALFGGFFDFYAQAPALARTFIREQLFLPPELTALHEALMQDFFGRLTGVLKTAQTRDEVAPDVPLPTACVNLFSLYLTTLIGFLNAPQDAQPAFRQHLRDGLRLQLRGLAPLPSRRRPPSPRSPHDP